MLINHEGIPGSGKTFEAVSKHLIPALKKGRMVYARIDGLNYEQLAKLAGITEESCRSVLIHVDEEHIHKLNEYTMPNGSLVLIDELQNYFPNQRKPLDPGITKWVAEHRHLGLDIVFMCQDLKDCHSIWRRRVDTKVIFSKLDMINKDKYSWKLYKAIRPEKFEEVSKGVETYDKAIFGSYKSFEVGAENNQAYEDKRRSLWSSKVFSRWLPLAGLAAVLGIAYMVYLFKGGGLQNALIPGQHGGTPRVEAAVTSPGAPSAAVSNQVQPGHVSSQQPAPPAPPPPPPQKWEKDFLQDMCERYRLRLSGVAKSQRHMWGVLEWYDDALHLHERLSIQAVQNLGYEVKVDDRLETATITKGKWAYVATQFPLDYDNGRVSDEKERQIANKAPGTDVPVGDQWTVMRASDAPTTPPPAPAPAGDQTTHLRAPAPRSGG